MDDATGRRHMVALVYAAVSTEAAALSSGIQSHKMLLLADGCWTVS